MQKIKNSYQLAKLGFSIINNDLRLILVQIFSAIALLSVIVVFGYYFYQSGLLTPLLNEETTTLPLPLIIGLIAVYLVSTIIYHLTEAVSIHLSLGQIRNDKKSLSSALSAVFGSLGGLLQFSFISATVGVVLKTLEEKLSWFGSLASHLTHGAWNIATPFAIPHLIEGEAKSGIDATRMSVKTFTTAFGENLLVRGGAGAFMGLAIVLWMIIFVMTLPIVAGIFVSDIAMVATFGFGFIGLIVLALISATIGSVLTALLYQYAKDGNSPSNIDKEVFKSMLTPKKARSVFSN